MAELHNPEPVQLFTVFTWAQLCVGVGVWSIMEGGYPNLVSGLLFLLSGCVLFTGIGVFFTHRWRLAQVIMAVGFSAVCLSALSRIGAYAADDREAPVLAAVTHVWLTAGLWSYLRARAVAMRGAAAGRRRRSA